MAISIGQEFWLKENKGTQGISEYESIGSFISAMLPNIYLVSGLILFILIVMAGFTIITSANNPQKLEKGNKILVSSLAGFALVFLSYWLIKLIEYLTGIKIFSSGI